MRHVSNLVHLVIAPVPKLQHLNWAKQRIDRQLELLWVNDVHLPQLAQLVGSGDCL